MLEDPFAFAAIRDYTPDDPMKTINWKASARTGSLMVNTFTSTVSSGVRVFLDVRMDPEQAYGEDLREDAVALAASLIIAAVTLVICLAGIRIGSYVGMRLAGKASVFGGLILIAIGIRILVSGGF